MGTPTDLVIMTVSSAFGTGSTIPLGSAATVGGVTFLSFSGGGATGGTVVDYSILDTAASEIGTATYNSSNTTLTSRTPTKSTNGNAAITASSAALIYGTIRAESLTPFITAGQLLGTATNDNASAGNVGQFVTSFISSGSAVTMARATATDVTTISITAGDWDARATAWFSSSANQTQLVISISTTANTFPALGSEGFFDNNGTFGTLNGVVTGPVRFSVAGTTTLHMVCQSDTLAAASTSILTYGTLSARRAR